MTPKSLMTFYDITHSWMFRVAETIVGSVVILDIIE